MGCVLAALALPAGASALPVYEGVLQFNDITSPSGPEEFSWEVKLAPEQTLMQMDEKHAEVFYGGGHPAYGIEAEPAHDANGASVPTTLTVIEPNTITLTVHHRAGNPAAGGAPFDYPIIEGAGWEGGITTVLVEGPPDESESRPKAKPPAQQHSARGLNLLCGEGGEVAKAHPRHCLVLGAGGLPMEPGDLARLRWHDWDESVARATGLLLNPKTHARKHVRVLAFGSVECDGVRYYKWMRLSGHRSSPITIDISPC